MILARSGIGKQDYMLYILLLANIHNPDKYHNPKTGWATRKPKTSKTLVSILGGLCDLI